MATRKRGDKWFADFMVDGSRHRVFGFSSELAASAWEAQARLALSLGKPLPAPPADATHAGAMTVAALVRHCGTAQWASRISGPKAIRTAELFAAFVGPRLPAAEALTSQQIAAYAQDLRNRGRSGSTVNRHLACLSVLIRHALAMGLIQRAPALAWSRPPPGKERDFTREQEDALLGSLRQWGRDHIADLFEFLADTGARLGEALQAHPSAITPSPKAGEPNRITFFRTKNGKPRTIPLTDRAFRAYMRHGGFADIKDHAIRTAWEQLRGAHSWLGDATPHTFRHTCACRLVQSGIDLYRVQLWMGHSSLSVTQRYARFSPKHLTELAGVLEKVA